MRSDYAELIGRRLALPPTEGPDKVTTLEEAVRRLIAPRQTIYLGAAHGRPNALVREVIRQWWGRRPGWTLAMTGFGSPWTAFVVGGLVERLVTTFIGEGYPYPTPQPLVGRAVLGGQVAVQNWSMLTMPLRLIGGALGVPFMPTRSLLGSSMEEDNARDGDFLAAPDPFFSEGADVTAPSEIPSQRGPHDPLRTSPSEGCAGGAGARRVGFVRSLKPDVALFHAWAADRAGNVLAAAPLNENFYAAMAARGGAIVSVEKVVSTEFIRRHAPLVRLPGQYVAAVVEAPFGAHPAGMYGMNVAELEGYAEDLDFILTLRRAFRKRETAEAWIKEWMLEVPDQGAYVARLGYQRLMEVKGRAHTDAWVWELEMLAPAIPADGGFTAAEMMVVAAARLLGEKVRARGYRAFLAGVGNSNLAAWLSAYELKAAGVDVELMAETGMVGYLPRPAEPFVFSFRNFPSSKMLTDIFHVMGIFMGGSENRCLGSLAAGQIDKHGNINSTIVPGTLYITGSGGANDIASSAREVVVTLAQSRERFVDKAPYITAPGTRVTTVVSDRGVYEKPDESSELILTGVLAGPPEAEAVRAAREACGWELKVAPALRRFDPPTPDELRLIRLFDPRRYFLG
ncbi:MAG TPA: CoA-transferase [Methylomirabilota bacterium]|jgi:acyl CoA:acetate/3-ketoacid CoA transferase alpha subunit|nr:CoA-transferase [Methylomirabilota bacterium]